MQKKAIILLSGGLDSTTTMAVAKKEGYELYALSFDYGQRHKIELEHAQGIARCFGAAKHLVMTINLRDIGGSALTSEIEVPKDRTGKEMTNDIPVTYVPARNTIFLSFALAWDEVIGAGNIFIGVNAIDYSGYPDCRPEFISAFEKMAGLATKTGVAGDGIKIHTPLIHMTKGEIIQKGIELGVDYSMTFSCYDPTGRGAPCGRCDSCLLRKKGFESAGIIDPL